MISRLLRAIRDGFSDEPRPVPYFYRLSSDGEPEATAYEEVQQHPVFSEEEVESMTRTELIQLAGDLGVSIKKSWTKFQIRTAIFNDNSNNQ